MAGANGIKLVLAVNHVVLENKQWKELVPILSQNTVESLVRELVHNQYHVMTMYARKVSEIMVSILL